MYTAVCRQQDEARQFDAHPSTFSQLLSRFRVTAQVSTPQRHRRQLETAVRQHRLIVTTSRRNSIMSATKVANELHWASGVGIRDQNVRNRLLRDVNLRARRPFVAIHLTQRHRETYAAWATTRLYWTQRQ
jgi:hypothetical protein